jgi:hypothetical protein
MKFNLWLEYAPEDGGSLTPEEATDVMVAAVQDFKDSVELVNGDRVRVVKLVVAKCMPINFNSVVNGG